VSGSRWAVIGVSLLLAGLTIGAYASLAHAGFILVDDDEYVERNPHILGGLNWPDVGWALTHQHSAMYHPLTTLSHMADVQFFGLSPGTMHLVNVLIHAANAVLLFIALRRLTKTLWPSAFVAAVFALHPQHVESVAWISERKDVLSGFFFMLCLLTYARYTERPSVGRYSVVMLALALGLLAKPMLVTVPIVLLIVDYWPLRRSGIRWLAIEKLPMFVLCAAMALGTLLTQTNKGAVSQLPLSLRLSNAVLSFMRYVGTFAWPTELSFFYPHRVPEGWPPILTASSAIALLFFSVIVVMFRRRYPALLAGWAWFIVMLLPVIGIVQVGRQAMADRYSYLPTIGLTIAVVWLARQAIPFARYARPAAICVSMLILICLVRTVGQVHHWENQEALFETSLENGGESGFLRTMLAWLYFTRGDVPASIANFDYVLSYEPENDSAHAKLGAVLLSIGQLDEARQHLELAARLNPKELLTFVFLAGLYQAQGNLDAAIGAAKQALAIDPNDVDAKEVLRKLEEAKRAAAATQPTPLVH
jgi:Tfp pilus assembly protein PilF